MPNLRVIITTFLFLLPLSNLAVAMEYEEGTHYVELQIPLNTRNPDKIEVAEYFSYGCPHCYQRYDAEATLTSQGMISTAINQVMR